MSEYDNIREAELRRRKIQEAILQQSLQPGGVYNVSGRTVPYSPFEGLTQLGKAMIARSSMDRGEERLEKARQAQEDKRKQMAEAVMKRYSGTPEIPGTPAVTAPQLGPPEFPEGTYETAPAVPATPAIPADPRGAMLLAASQKETEPMVAAMKGAQAPQGSMFYTYDTDAKGNLWRLPGRPGEEPQMVKTAEGKPVELAKWSPKRKGDIAEAVKSGAVTGEERTMAAIDLPAVKSNAEYLKSLVEKAKTHPGMSGTIGIPNILTAGGLVPGTKEADFRLLQKQILGKQFLQVYETLKGGGQITEIEGQKATEALSRMGTASSEKAYIDASDEFISEIDRLSRLAEERATGKMPAGKSEAAPVKSAPQQAIDYLMQNNTPEVQRQFQQKYGYLPNG